MAQVSNFKYAIKGDVLQAYEDGTYKPRTVWERVYLHLKSKGIDVYSPGQHEGICEDSYVVIKNAGTMGYDGSNQIGSQTLDIMVYYPASNYSGLEPYTNTIQDFLKELREYIRPSGNITTVILDKDVQGYTQTLEYTTMQKLRR